MPLTGAGFVEGRRGGIVLMSSLTAMVGTPYISAYGASKAFNLSLGEGLAFELIPKGIDVLICAPGPTATSNYLSSFKKGQKAPASVMSPEQVVQQTFNALGKRQLLIPGLTNKLLSILLGKLLPRRWAAALMGKNTQKLDG